MQKPTSTLVHGINLMSKRLKYSLNPMSLMYQFDTRKPANPRPMTLMIALLILSSLIGLFIVDFSIINEISDAKDNSQALQQAVESVFFLRLFRLNEVYRLTTHIAIILITLYYHENIANVIAQNNNLVDDREQDHIGRISFTVYIFKTICSCITFATIAISCDLSRVHNTIFGTILIFFINLTCQAPIMYTCYLGAALGKHIENFSQLYIDTLFDQCVKVKDGENPLNNNFNSRPEVNSIDQEQTENDDEKDDTGKRRGCCRYVCCVCCCCTGFFRSLTRLIRQIGWILVRFWSMLKELGKFLNSRKYPELPEMKMTKLSSKIEITDSMRITNSHLIRIRLRKTQIMLSELRDTVSDINKMSSPIIMMKILQETLMIVVIATGSIQAKAYKSISILIVPTIANTIGLFVGVSYICTSLDDTTSQLKLMINKLFDFIIMNHRVDYDPTLSSSRNSATRMSLPPTGNDREDEALSETWSQFQYTRKLANTIQFTMGGILTVSRRLVLPILGHILSAVFISIEIMSIIDTSKDITKTHMHPDLNIMNSNRANHHSNYTILQ